MPLGESETIQMVDATVIAPGSDFGPRYRIEALLGQGGMGRVYKAYDKDLDRTVAIKVVRDGAIGETDALKRFKQELVLASKISHKNILRIHDMGDVGGLRFISMAYVEGQDLQHIIRDNPKMPLERILNFSRQIAEALAAAHAEGVVHRDLKPQNLLVDKNDQIFVCDFGLAKSFEEGAIGMTRTGAFLGTPRYMSPEQVEGKPADGRADLYAFGLILYEMVIGDVPFTGESTLKVMYQRIQEKPKSPKILRPDLPNWLVKIIMRCLERDPNDRYQNAYEILADLQGGQSGSGASRVGMSRIGSGSQSVIIQIPEFASRRWVWIVAGVVAALLAGAGDTSSTASDPRLPRRADRDRRLRILRNPAALQRPLRRHFAAASSRRPIAARLPGARHSGSALGETVSVERCARHLVRRCIQGRSQVASAENRAQPRRQYARDRDGAGQWRQDPHHPEFGGCG